MFGAVAPPGSASCAYPSIEVAPSAIEGGGTIAVAGYGFGTDCYDTGPPPQGACGRTVGTLGEPRSDIELRIAVLGTGNEPRPLAGGITADHDYRFLATIRIPEDLEPGKYEILAWYPGESGRLIRAEIRVGRPSRSGW
jgi:hypothetical protein